MLQRPSVSGGEAAHNTVARGLLLPARQPRRDASDEALRKNEELTRQGQPRRSPSDELKEGGLQMVADHTAVASIEDSEQPAVEAAPT